MHMGWLCGAVGMSSLLIIGRLIVRFPVCTDHMPSVLGLHTDTPVVAPSSLCSCPNSIFLNGINKVVLKKIHCKIYAKISTEYKRKSDKMFSPVIKKSLQACGSSDK